MKLVNSSFFGLRSDVTSVEQAVGLLGVDVIRGLVLANSLFAEPSAGAAWLDLAGLADRSQTVAALARAIAKVDGHTSREQALAFLSGMVHGAGLLLLCRCPSVNIPSSTGVEYSIDPSVDTRLFGVDRYALGAYLLRLWGFETGIVEAVAGLAVEPHLMSSPTARSLRAANELVAWGGFSVAEFVEGDPETRALVAAMRVELDKRLELGEPATAA
jgi:HD-like signal output (HDOD) protein